MTKIVNFYQAVLAATILLLSTIFGVYWFVFASYILLNVIDWLTGWLKARMMKQVSSAIGLIGIIKKLGYWAIIFIAFMLSNAFIVFGNTVLHINLTFLESIGYFTLACLIVNEARSIIENLVVMGYKIPSVLIDGLSIVDKLINKKDDIE